MYSPLYHLVTPADSDDRWIPLLSLWINNLCTSYLWHSFVSDLMKQFQLEPRALFYSTSQDEGAEGRDKSPDA